MRIGIDASNVVVGGGLTHLCELIRHGEPRESGIEQVIVWCGDVGDKALPRQDWLDVRNTPELNGSVVQRAWWQYRTLPRLARGTCDLVFSPGGRIARGFRPTVTMFQNMLPFSPEERARYGWCKMRLRLLLLRQLQGSSFRDADGVIYLTEHARQTVLHAIGQPKGTSAIIPHGINPAFFAKPRKAFSAESYSMDAPMRLLYVSTIDVYKHPWHVAEAVSMLRRQGVPVRIDFAGTAYGPSLKRLNDTIRRLDPSGEFLRHLGPVPYAELGELYTGADLFVFASSCENLPIILLEAMSAGLPIACSNREPMPTVLGNAGVLFDPERPESIAQAIRELFYDPDKRARLARSAYERAWRFSWQRCAEQTFAFLAQIAKQSAP